MTLNSRLGARYNVGKGDREIDCIHTIDLQKLERREDFLGIQHCQRATVVLQAITNRSTLVWRCFESCQQQRRIRDDVFFLLFSNT